MPAKDSNSPPSWSGAGASLDTIDGIEYSAVEIQHLITYMRIRHLDAQLGRDDGTTEMKVLAYVIRRRDPHPELLVFVHADNAGAGIQVPAGTIEPGEHPEAAAVRELVEETAITNASLIGRIDVYEWKNPETGRWQRRHVYQFGAPADLPDRWEHAVSAGSGDVGMRFTCYWLPLSAAETALCGDQGFSIRRTRLQG